MQAGTRPTAAAAAALALAPATASIVADAILESGPVAGSGDGNDLNVKYALDAL